MKFCNTCNKTNLRLNITSLWVVFVALIFIKPQIADDIPILDLFFNVGRVLLSIIYGALLLLKCQRIKKEWVYLVGIFMITFLMTVIHDGNYIKAIAHYVPSIGLLSFIIYNKEKLVSYFKVIFRLDCVLLILNVITFFCFPDGMIYRPDSSVKVWLLGQKQDLAGFVFPMLFIALYLRQLKIISTPIFFLCYSLCFITTLIEFSIAAFGCLLIFGLLCLLDKCLRIKFSGVFLVCSCAATFIIVQYFSFNFDNMSGLHEILSQVTYEGVSKYRNLTTRFTMWNFAWNNFFDSYLFGMGELSSAGWDSGVGFYHSVVDNMYMDIIMTGGTIGIILFMLLLYRSFLAIERFSHYRDFRYMNYCLFVVCIYIFFGSPFFPMIFLLFSVSAWLPKMENNIEKCGES